MTHFIPNCQYFILYGIESDKWWNIHHKSSADMGLVTVKTIYMLSLFCVIEIKTIEMSILTSRQAMKLCRERKG